MKNIRLILIVLLFCGFSSAQDNKPSFTFTLDDGCGNPLVESQTYGIFWGKIIRIISANQIILEQSNISGRVAGEKFTITIVGINKEYNKSKIIGFLKKHILNQNVEIRGNLRKESEKAFGGLVFVNSKNDEIDWINENLLELGIAKYKDFSSDNLVPYTTPCQLEKAEQRARTAKLGIWAK